MKRLLLLAVCLCAPAFAQNYTTITASDIADASNGTLVSGQIHFQATDGNGHLIGFRLPGGGQGIVTVVDCNVVTGAITTETGGGICKLANTTLTDPVNLCYQVTITDNVTGSQVQGPGYQCYQPSGASDDFDNFIPQEPTIAPSTPGPTGPPGPDGGPGAPGPQGTGGTAYPVQGVPSGGDPTTTAGTITSSTTVVLASANSFVTGQGVMVAHAGPACGVLRGTPCPWGPTPSLTVTGATGSTSYSYQTACVDGLGAASQAGGAASITNGPATLTATNYVNLIMDAQAGCIEVAVYRNGALVGEAYSPTSGTFTFSDTGTGPQGVGGPFTHRDIPATPSAAVADNYVGFVTMSGTTATVTPPMAIVSGSATVYHSDTPMLQRAVDAGNVDAGFNASGNVVNGTNFRLNYPLNLTNHSGTYTFAAALDTGDIGLDMTGQKQINLLNVNLNRQMTMTAPSSMGIFCAREADGTAQGRIAQYFNSTNLYIDTHGILSGANHLGAVGVYNFGCEIERHDAPNVNAESPWVFTASNIDNVQSLFDSNQQQADTSMSAITLMAPSGGTIGTDFLFENTYSVTIHGGYMLGADSTTNPYVMEFVGQNGHFDVSGFRSEGKSGAAYIHQDSTLIYGSFNMGVFHANDAPLPMFKLDDSGSISSMHPLMADDFGGSPFHVPYYACATSNCGLENNDLYVGVNQDFDLTDAACNTGTWVNHGDFLCPLSNLDISTGIVTWSTARRLPIGSNLDTLTGCGFYDVPNATSGGTYPISPGTTQVPIYSRVTNNCSADPLYLVQEVSDMAITTDTSYRRQRAVDGWKPWVQVAPVLPVGTVEINGKCPSGTSPSYTNGIATACN